MAKIPEPDRSLISETQAGMFGTMSRMGSFVPSLRSSGVGFEKHVYPGANHAFFNDDGPSYDEGAALDSFWRLLAFFAGVLSG